MKTFKYSINKGEKLWICNDALSKNNYYTKYTNYVLEIKPLWTSLLGGNPAAILVEATHTEGKYHYQLLWANYDDSNETFKFAGVDLDGSDTIEMFPTSESASTKIINNYINPDTDLIRIKIDRIYDGVIEFKLTPIMSYGPLNHLSKTITLDLSKVASGEIILSKWSYIINRSIAEVISDTAVSENIIENIKTTTTLQKLDDNTTVEIKQVDTTQTKDIKPATTHTTYIYTMNLTYGFDSYKFDNLTPTVLQSIKFYDLKELNLYDLPKDESNYYYNTLQHILTNYTPAHVEVIPIGLLSGGNTTINYILDSTECKLKPDMAYLCICELVTQIKDEVLFIHYDYRYLYTNSIFNEYFGIEEDYNDLNLSIQPSIDPQFKSDKIKETLSENSNIKWLSDKLNTFNKTVTFEYNVDPSLEALSLFYTDNLFTLKYNIDVENVSNKSVISFPSNSTNNILKSEYNYSNESENGVKLILCDYTFDVKMNTKLDSIEISALKTNLLNLTNSTNEHKVFLSEANGLSESMMLEEDSIFSVGMHNDGDGEEGWYGEVGTISEGFTTTAVKYDDSIEANRPNEIDLKYYYDDVSVKDTNGKCNYYLKHGSELLQYPSEKDDSSETLYNYLESGDPHLFLLDSLETRSIVPILFVTSGPKEHKGKSCVGVSCTKYRAASAPTTMVKNKDDKDSEDKNFNEDNPYWFLSWSGVNAYNSTEVIGTFLIKYINSKGVSTYIPSNNYFAVSCVSNELHTAYLEDCIQMINSTYSSSAPSGYKTEPKSYVHKIPVNPNPKGCVQTSYTIGDLLSTQLALFAAINYYNTPILINGEFYTISDEDKESLNNSMNQTIDITSTYIYEFTEDSLSELNKSIFIDSINLNDVYTYLPSNNLKVSPTLNKFTFLDKISLTPLINILPNFSTNSYLVTISPSGEISYENFSKNANDCLYYWNDSDKTYKVYTSNTSVELYKYGKFKKFIDLELVKENNYYINNNLNSNNYSEIKNYNSLLDNFIICNFNPDKKQSITMPLKYAKYKGLYTTSQRGRTDNIRFVRFDNPNAIKEKGLRYIINVASLPKLLFKNSTDDELLWWIDPKQRL